MDLSEVRSMNPVRPGAWDYLLKDIDRERRIPLDDLIHENDNEAPKPPPKFLWKPVTPPPREPERRRTHITIELVPTYQRPKKRRSWTGAVIVWAIVAAIWMGLAHGQPTEWRSQQEGFLTRMQGIDRQGRNWTGTSYQQGHLTIIDANGPNGQMVHCTAQKEGFQIVTRCD
jgi:hypothetical protein